MLVVNVDLVSFFGLIGDWVMEFELIGLFMIGEDIIVLVIKKEGKV